jgi:hypothetical protein
MSRAIIIAGMCSLQSWQCKCMAIKHCTFCYFIFTIVTDETTPSIDEKHPPITPNTGKHLTLFWEYFVFSWTVRGKGSAVVLKPASASYFLYLCVQLSIYKTTKGNGLKRYTLDPCSVMISNDGHRSENSELPVCRIIPLFLQSSSENIQPRFLADYFCLIIIYSVCIDT